MKYIILLSTFLILSIIIFSCSNSDKNKKNISIKYHIEDVAYYGDESGKKTHKFYEIKIDTINHIGYSMSWNFRNELAWKVILIDSINAIGIQFSDTDGVPFDNRYKFRIMFCKYVFNVWRTEDTTYSIYLYDCKKDKNCIFELDTFKEKKYIFDKIFH